MKISLRVAVLTVAVVLMGSCAAMAATINGKGWYNESANTHTMQVWVMDADVSIKSVKINKDTTSSWSWRYADDTKTSVILSGLETSGMNNVSPDFQFTSPSKNKNFSVEWAEVGKENTLTGTNYYKNKRWSYTKGDISHTPTPIPGAVFILGGGLSILAFIRRKFLRS